MYVTKPNNAQRKNKEKICSLQNYLCTPSKATELTEELLNYIYIAVECAFTISSTIKGHAY
jgi:hypothetical protein